MCLRSNFCLAPVFNKPLRMANARKRIAVVDDDASIRRALQRLLYAFAFDAETYGSGREFLAAVHAFRPDCVILDLHMEGMSGLDVQRHLRRIGIGSPVVVISGHDNPGTHAESFALGAAEFLPKPVDGELLISTIERLTDKSVTLPG